MKHAARVGRAFLGVELLLIIARPAGAVEITDCGQVIPAGDVGVLTVDLSCPRLPEGNPPAVSVQHRGTLMLNGHTITAPDNTAVNADFVVRNGKLLPHRFAVVGPGEITGATTAISGIGTVVVSNVSIHDNRVGIVTFLDASRGRVKASNVSITDTVGDPFGSGGGVALQAHTVVADGLAVTGATFDGIFVRRIRGKNVIASDNGPGHTVQGFGFGIVAENVNLRNLTATNNDGNGVIARTVHLRDSTVTGNTGQWTGDVDIFADRRPRLQNTTCGRSQAGDQPAGTTWGVCQND